jgi:hypothetical protein
VGIIVDREMREKSLDMVEGGDLGGCNCGNAQLGFAVSVDAGWNGPLPPPPLER